MSLVSYSMEEINRLKSRVDALLKKTSDTPKLSSVTVTAAAATPSTSTSISLPFLQLNPIAGSSKRPKSSQEDGDDDEQDVDVFRPKLKSFCTDKSVLEDLLDCPYCMNLCVPPIFICETGHHLCKVCRRAYKECPTCESPFGKGRNFFLENYFNNNCTFACLFEREGCDKIELAGKDLQSHYRECDFRPMPCIMRECPVQSIVYSKYLNHLEMLHDYKFMDCEQSTFEYTIGVRNFRRLKKKKYAWRPRPFKAEGATFFAMNVLEDRCFGSWVFIFGNQEQASRFRVAISIRSNTTGNTPPQYCQMWEGPVIPLRKHTGISILSLGKCMTVSHNYILRIIQEDNNNANPNGTGTNNVGDVTSSSLGSDQIRNESFGGADPEPEGVGPEGDFTSWTVKIKLIPMIIDG